MKSSRYAFIHWLNVTVWNFRVRQLARMYPLGCLYLSVEMAQVLSAKYIWRFKAKTTLPRGYWCYITRYGYVVAHGKWKLPIADPPRHQPTSPTVDNDFEDEDATDYCDAE